MRQRGRARPARGVDVSGPGTQRPGRARERIGCPRTSVGPELGACDVRRAGARHAGPLVDLDVPTTGRHLVRVMDPCVADRITSAVRDEVLQRVHDRAIAPAGAGVNVGRVGARRAKPSCLEADRERRARRGDYRRASDLAAAFRNQLRGESDGRCHRCCGRRRCGGCGLCRGRRRRGGRCGLCRGRRRRGGRCGHCCGRRRRDGRGVCDSLGPGSRVATASGECHRDDHGRYESLLHSSCPRNWMSLRQAPEADQPAFGRIAFAVERRLRGWVVATGGGQMSDSAKCTGAGIASWRTRIAGR